MNEELFSHAVTLTATRIAGKDGSQPPRAVKAMLIGYYRVLAEAQSQLRNGIPQGLTEAELGSWRELLKDHE